MNSKTLLFFILLKFNFAYSQTEKFKCSFSGHFEGNQILPATGLDYTVIQGDSFRFYGTSGLGCTGSCGYTLYGPSGGVIYWDSCSKKSPYYTDTGVYKVITGQGMYFGIENIHVVFATLTGISKNEGPEIIYKPNPVSDELSISLKNVNSSKVIYAIYNSIGQLLNKNEIDGNSNEIVIPFRNFESGLYIIEISDIDRKFKKHFKIFKTDY
jgi:hypothetical protein